MEQLIENIVGSIEEGKYEKAFAAFAGNFQNEKRLSNFADLGGRFKELVKSFAEGIISLAEYMLEENKLVKELLHALSLISKKFKYQAKHKRIRIEFTIGGKLAEWTESVGKKIKNTLSSILDISDSSMSIVSLSAGSIKVVLELPQNAITELLAGKFVNEIQKDLEKSDIQLRRVRPVYEINRIPIGGTTGEGINKSWLKYLFGTAIVGLIVLGVIQFINTDPEKDNTKVSEAQEVSVKTDSEIDSESPEVTKDLVMFLEILDWNGKAIYDTELIRSFKFGNVVVKESEVDKNVLKLSINPNYEGNTMELILDNYKHYRFRNKYKIGNTTYKVKLPAQSQTILIQFNSAGKYYPEIKGTLNYKFNTPNGPKQRTKIVRGRGQIKINLEKHKLIFFYLGNDMNVQAVEIANNEVSTSNLPNPVILDIKSTIY